MRVARELLLAGADPTARDKVLLLHSFGCIHVDVHKRVCVNVSVI